MDEPQPSVILKTEVEETPAKEEAMQVLTAEPTPAPVSEPEVKAQTKTTLKGLWIGAAIAAVLIAIVFFWVTRSKSKESVSPVVATPTPDSTVEPSPTPTAEAPARDTLKVQVLNASGVKGAAGKLKETLLAKGYKTVDTGNADTEQEGTTVSAASGKLSSAEMIVSDLGVVGAKADDLLESTSEYDVVVTLGK